VAINDGNVDSSTVKVWFLDSACKYKSAISYPTAPLDPEDLAIGKDGTIWVADFGDNDKQRSRIALWKVAPSGTPRPQIFRFTYPDGAHDAEALLLAADDTPIIVTKDYGDAGIYVPSAALDPTGTAVPLKKVGDFKPVKTGTPNPLEAIGTAVVTGGANSPDR